MGSVKPKAGLLEASLHCKQSSVLQSVPQLSLERVWSRILLAKAQKDKMFALPTIK